MRAQGIVSVVVVYLLFCNGVVMVVQLFHVLFEIVKPYFQLEMFVKYFSQNPSFWRTGLILSTPCIKSFMKVFKDKLLKLIQPLKKHISTRESVKVCVISFSKY